jgi:hypothetical protein
MKSPPAFVSPSRDEVLLLLLLFYQRLGGAVEMRIAAARVEHA